MAFLLRKLLFDDSEIPSDCKQYCSPLNTEGKCPPSCNSPICLYYCTKPLNDDVSPLPSTPNDNNDSPDEPHLVPNSSHHTISLFLTIPLVIISTILFFLICFTIYKLCIKRYALRRRRELNRAGENLPGPDPDLLLDEDHGPNQGPAVEHHVWYIRTVGLDPSVISQITIVKYNKTDGLIEGTDCSVCLSGFEENETLRLLPKCNHAFHLPCIDTWLTSHTTCPLCRAGIVKNTVNLPSHEVIVQDSSSVEENLGEISRTSSSGEELRVDDVGNNTRLVGRSVSMDALSGAIIRNDCERSSGDQIVDVKELDGKRDGGINQLLRLVGSLSIDRPACIKRSASCSANVL